MKYRTFRAIVVTVALGLFGAGVWWYKASSDERDREARIDASAAERPAVAPAGRPAAAPSESNQRIKVEAYLLATLGTSAASDKQKDAVPGPIKVNVYNEGGVWARAKVDLDRDDKWDEKWHLDGGVVVREIAPSDDESYTRTWRRVGEFWEGDGVDDPDLPHPRAAAAAAAADGLRPVDRDLLRALKGPARAKIKDATQGTPYKINLYSDGGARFERAKVDLDRDDKWDEKWTIEADGAIQREVAPADDEVYSEVHRLVDGAWVKG